MTRKDYVAIAKIISDNSDWMDAGMAVEEIGKALADYFELNNSRFDRETFLAACGDGDE